MQRALTAANGLALPTSALLPWAYPVGRVWRSSVLRAAHRVAVSVYRGGRREATWRLKADLLSADPD